MATKAYIAKRTVNIDMLMGNYIDDLVFTILDADGAAFDFSAANSLALRIYDKRTSTRALIDTLVSDSSYPWTDVAYDMTETGGVITVDTAFPSGMTFGKYNYELDYVDSQGSKRLAEGTINII